MSYSYADYTAAVADELANDGFYRYPKEFQPALVFASKNSDGTTVMVGDIVLPKVTLCANSSFAGNMKTMDGHSTEECFPFYKFVFALPVLKQLDSVEGIENYLKLVQKPEMFETEIKDLLAAGMPMQEQEYVEMFHEKFLSHYGGQLFSGLKEELSKMPHEEVQKLVDEYSSTSSSPTARLARLASSFRLISNCSGSCRCWS